MNQFLVTVKIPKGLGHDPQNKKTGVCPVKPGRFCTDITGEHHTFLWEDDSLQDSVDRWNSSGMHITRVEEV